MSKVTIIAEAGVNHNGSYENALKLIDIASEAGADYVKFQTGNPEDVVSKNMQKAKYQERNELNKNENMFEMLKRLALQYDDFAKLKKYCKKKNIGFLTTPFDVKSMEYVYGLNVDYMKIPSGEITNYQLLKKASQYKDVPILLSTGMCNISEIEEAIKILDNKNITILQCTTQYPTPYCDVNLLAIDLLKEYFNLPVGLSDHTLGTVVSSAAVAKGVSVIEKHFTIDKNMEGPDHAASLSPNELKELVLNVRIVEQAMGVKEKKVTASEQENITVARKYLVAKQYIKKGQLITNDMITAKRTSVGICPMRINTVIGTFAVKDFKKDDNLCI